MVCLGKRRSPKSLLMAGNFMSELYSKNFLLPVQCSFTVQIQRLWCGGTKFSEKESQSAVGAWCAGREEHWRLHSMSISISPN
jgi:hypothetical protein